MKTAKIKLESIKDSDGWMSLAYSVAFEKFEKENPGLDEEELAEKFNDEIVYKRFEYGEFADIEIEVDENFNIVGGKILSK